MASVTQGSNAFVYQIFYNQETREQLDPGFIPLDNTANLRPDWYEFWVIRNFLKQNTLRENVWYGFLSPKFVEKSSIDAEILLSILEQCDAHCDVALFSSGWDQIAYFRNPFEQGDFWHPGLTQLSQFFVDTIGANIDLTNLVTTSNTSVFSNYVVAKPAFWRHWLQLADTFFEFVEGPANVEFRENTTYGSNIAPMKTFVQERLVTLILSQGGYRVASPDVSHFFPINPVVFRENDKTRKLLQTCALLKEKYTETGDIEYLNVFYKIRAAIEIVRR